MVAPYHPASWNQFGKCVEEVDVGMNMLLNVNIAVGNVNIAVGRPVVMS